MSAFTEFDQERREINELLEQGYRIVNIEEDLDGARVKFMRSGPVAAVQVLQLLTADARKHVTTVLPGIQRTPEEAVESSV
ncbi:hypothetical protein [Paenibacillus tengchongensis]|uniref:hypothetical protein n=1 Tax=Paenibacillus tengchongensis TaxID=2608684 RepID=UPI00124DE84D|nr:hypothetical protein [Paenibacillus tengchongensis]